MKQKMKFGSRRFGVIFDMDGVLIDSEPLQMKVFNVMLKKRGVTIAKKEFVTYVGMKAIDNFRDVIRKYRLEATPEELIIEKNALYHRVLKGPLKPMPGIRLLLTTLKKAGIPMAVVSGSNSRDVGLVLKGLGLTRYFPLIVSGDDVRRGKPHPEGFLKASAMMGLKRADIFVIEDSAPGVNAGRKGGFRVLAVPTPFTRSQDFSPADRIFRNYREILGYMRTELASGAVKGREAG